MFFFFNFFTRIKRFCNASLQAFKLKTANTVITAENSSLTTMSTEKVRIFLQSLETSRKNGYLFSSTLVARSVCAKFKR